ncbi:hypothetical protein J3486_03605 [Streptomyces sp. VRA16 Mangrove soil]|nr:hypothetical protein [Streptomyces sp. VRA16 Mangrove soil]MBO1330342.1 hypothetical protein [Streptomyces sp. VRA16 Mangrove soil]
MGVVEEFRRETGAGLPAVGHDRVLPERGCGRTLQWGELTEPTRNSVDNDRRS